MNFFFKNPIEKDNSFKYSIDSIKYVFINTHLFNKLQLESAKILLRESQKRNEYKNEHEKAQNRNLTFEIYRKM